MKLQKISSQKNNLMHRFLSSDLKIECPQLVPHFSFTRKQGRNADNGLQVSTYIDVYVCVFVFVCMHV